GLSVDERYQDVRRLEVTMDDALLMSVLHGLADGGEQVQPFADAELGLVAEPGQRQAVDQLHDKKWRAEPRKRPGVGRRNPAAYAARLANHAAVEDARNVG